MTALNIDYAAEAGLRRIVGGLRSVRLDAGLTQEALATGLPVRGRAVSEWETSAIEPTLRNLMLWSQKLNQRMVVIGRDGTVHMNPVAQRPGEPWFVFERRRLAFPLRNRRIALGMSQEQLGELVGVSKDSIQRWELSHVPPRPIAHVVWAQRLGYDLEIRPIVAGFRRTGSASASVRGPHTVTPTQTSNTRLIVTDTFDM